MRTVRMRTWSGRRTLPAAWHGLAWHGMAAHSVRLKHHLSYSVPTRVVFSATQRVAPSVGVAWHDQAWRGVAWQNVVWHPLT
jgi:hypothetical protein